ncbi:MAG: hypothetical protein J6Q48_02325 [Bacteroidaceae bacterium]|nr:hypothetical protein [Bacteroidaceae bacterium]
MVQFRFQWAVASDEQYNLIMRYINTKTRSDPLNDNGTFTYEYDYLSYYLALKDMDNDELNAWLDTDPVLPNSIVNSVRASQLLMLKSRIKECIALKPVVDQYKEVLRWQFQATYKGQITIGFIEPGGWYRNQDPDLCFRFVSELPYIGYKDFNNVTIEFEVGNE